MGLKYNNIVYVFILALCLLGSCDKCDHFYEIALLSEEEKAFNPYQGFEQLVFTNQYNDTLVMRSKARVNYVEEVMDYDPSASKCTLLGTYMLERDTIHFRTYEKGPATFFNLQHTVKYSFGEPTPNAFDRFEIYIYNHFNGFFIDTDREYDSDDTITINGSLYSDVSYQIDIGTNEDLYYSKVSGIIGFTSPDSIVWSLVP